MYGFTLEGDTDPDGIANFFSSASNGSQIDGFGPGDYSGGYTGSNDRVYWGPSSKDPPRKPLPPQTVQNTKLVGDISFGPGFALDALGEIVEVPQTFDANASSTNETVLLPPSSGPSYPAPDPVSIPPSEDTSFNTGTEVISEGTGTTATQSDAAFSRAAGRKGISAVIQEDIDEQMRGGGSIEMQPLNVAEEDDNMSWIYDGDSDIGTIDPQTLDPDALEGKMGEVPEAVPQDIEMQPMRRQTNWRGSLGDEHVFADLPDLPEDTPLLLSEMPDSTPGFDLSSLNWDLANKPEVRSALTDYFSSDASLDASVLSSEGIGQDIGLLSRTGFTNFAEARLMDLGIGTIIQPFFTYLDHVSGTPWVSRGIQGTLALAGLAFAEDPFGVIAAPIAWGLQEMAKQNWRKLENDKPDANYGKRYGFVREGDKWYPAFLTRAERDEGWIGSDRTQIRLSYGRNLKFKREKGTGRMIPYFDDGAYRQKDFHAWDNELDVTNEQSGKAWRDQADPMRDFYFLDEDQTESFLQKLGGGETAAKYADDREHIFTAEEQAQIQAAQKAAFDMMQVHDDLSWSETWAQYGTEEQQAHYGQYAQYVDTLQDTRRGLEAWQDYLTSEPGATYTVRQDENQYEGSKAFRRVINDSGYLGYQQELKGQMRRPTGSSPEEMQANAVAIGKETPEGLWLLGEWSRAKSALYDAQKRAGDSMHFARLFADTNNVKDGAPSWMRDSKQLAENAWRLYTDGSWEIGDTTTDAGFAEALRAIEASGDSGLVGTHDYRSADQRDYLANKAYVRYLSSKLDLLGFADKKKNWARLVGHSKEGAYQAEHKMTNGRPMQVYGSDFGLDPAYSFADDYESGGYGGTPGSFKYSLEGRDYDRADGPTWMQDLAAWYDSDVSPDQVAGRFRSRDDFLKAMTHVASGNEPAALENLEPWDPWGENVPIGTMPWDAVQHRYVLPQDKTPGTQYDPDTETYRVANTGPVSTVNKTPVPPATVHGGDTDFWGQTSTWGQTDDDETDVEYWYEDEEEEDGQTDATVIEQPPVEQPVAPVKPQEPQRVPDDTAEAGAHVHEEAETEPDVYPDHPDLPEYMQQQHEERTFQHSSAPMHIPPTHTKVV